MWRSIMPLKAILYWIPFLCLVSVLPGCGKKGYDNTPEGRVRTIRAALENLDENAAVACFDTSTPEGKAVAALLEVSFKTKKRARAFFLTVRDKYGETCAETLMGREEIRDLGGLRMLQVFPGRIHIRINGDRATLEGPVKEGNPQVNPEDASKGNKNGNTENTTNTAGMFRKNGVWYFEVSGRIKANAQLWIQVSNTLRTEFDRYFDRGEKTLEEAGNRKAFEAEMDRIGRDLMKETGDLLQGPFQHLKQ